MKKTALMLEIAKGCVGIRELGENAGFTDKQFEADMKSAGWSKGLSWCAFFLKYLVVSAGLEEHAKFMNGGVVATFGMVSKSKLWRISKTPEVGALCFWQGKGGKGHCGIVQSIVDSPTSQDICIFIEGNTNAAGSREGERCMAKRRNYKVPNASWKHLGFAIPVVVEDENGK